MADYSRVTIKKLFGLSMNVCAFPMCENQIVDKNWPGVLGEICHICAANAGGPRYDPSMTDEDRYDFDNLILLCPTHHTLVDRLEMDKYTVDVLRQMKEQIMESAMSGQTAMFATLGDEFIDRSVVEIIAVSQRHYSLPPLPPMTTTSPAFLEGRVDITSTVRGDLTVPIAEPTVDEQVPVVDDSASAGGVQVNFTANMGGPYEEVTMVGGPSVIVDHEVTRGAHDEEGVADEP